MRASLGIRTSRRVLGIALAGVAAMAVVSAACSSESTAVSGAGVSDAGLDPDACAACEATLLQGCGPLGAECPPDLDSPTLSAWVERFARSKRARLLGCFASGSCSQEIVLSFSVGVDCERRFVFDGATKKLRAFASSCNFSPTECASSGECIANRCLALDAATVPNAAACPSITYDASSGPTGCMPHPVASPKTPTPAYRPPARSESCSAAQIDAFVTACLGADTSTCAAWKAEPSNAACVACATTSSSASAWGPVVSVAPGDTLLDVAGCVAIALGEPSSTSGCGAARWALDRCLQTACPLSECFADVANPTAAERQTYSLCRSDAIAAGSPCESPRVDYSAACSALADDATAGRVEAVCPVGDDPPDRAHASSLVSAFCGVRSSDAGAD